jgi:hypothetical protein
MKSNRRIRDAQAKARRQKIMIGIGGSILALVLAIQVPKMMKLISPGGEQAAAADTASAHAGSAHGRTAAPTSTISGSPHAATAVTAAAGPTAASAEAKVPSFDRFQSKDPFAPQLTAAAARPTESAVAAPAAPAAPEGPNSSPSSLMPAGPKPAATAARVEPATATISVDGVSSTISVGDTFPERDPVFKLAALTSGAAKIAIAAGSYANGAKLVTIRLHGSLTLLNTATGVRYRLQLLSLQ